MNYKNKEDASKKKLIPLSERLRNARKSRGLSQDRLLGLLDADYHKYTIGRSKLSVLENLTEEDELETLDIKLGTLYGLGDVLDFDIFYYLGVQEPKRLLYSQVSELIGISEESVAYLRNLETPQKRTETLSFINAIISSKHFSRICYEYSELMKAKHHYDCRKQEFEDAPVEDRPDKKEWIEQSKEEILQLLPDKGAFYANARSAVRIKEKDFLDEIVKFIDEMGEKGLE